MISQVAGTKKQASAKKRIGVVRFLGSNCDQDVWNALEQVGFLPEWLWYEDQANTKSLHAIVLPGGFSYGDYLRSGALAARSPVMKSVREAAKRGAPVLGICNGFQVLCEAGLLPGALVKNFQLRFIDDWVNLNGMSKGSLWSDVLPKGIRTQLPIAHGDGRYYADSQTMDELFDKDRVFAIYEEGSNYNGSLRDIAGVLNAQKNVCGLMPHPERAINLEIHGEDEGLNFFEVLR